MFSKTNIFETGWIEVVFEGRNQGYGAFKLRKQESRTTLVSMISVMAFFTVLLAIPFMHKHKVEGLGSTIQSVFNSKDDIIEITNYPVYPPTPSTNNAKPTTSNKPVIVKDEKANEIIDTAQKTPTVAGTGTANTGTSNTGNDTAGRGENPGIITAKTNTDGNEIHIGTAIMPEFPGGSAAFKQFINKMLNYPGIAIENGTQGKVVVSAVVEKDGSISSISVISKVLGDGLEEEAMRVVGKMPKWTPGLQNEQPVRVRISIPIRYQLK